MKLFLLFIFSSYLLSQVNGDVNVSDRDRDSFYLSRINQLDNNKYDYKRSSIRFSIPPIRFGKILIINDLGVDQHKFDFGDNAYFENDKLDPAYNINHTLLVSYQISKSLSLNTILTPHVIFSDEIELDDLKWNGNIILEKEFFGGTNQRSLKVSGGIGYQTLFGETTIASIINVRGYLSQSVSFAMGLPNSYVNFNLSNTHSIKILAELNDISVKLLSNNEHRNTLIHNSVLIGFEYNYWLFNQLAFSVRCLYSMKDKFTVDNHLGIELHNFNPISKPYIGIGIKFNPLKF